MTDQANDRLDFASDNLPVGLYRTTADGKWTSVNETMARLFGFPNKDAFMATSVADCYANPEDRQTHLEERRVGKDDVTSVIKLRRQDGSTWWGRDRSRGIKDEAGNLVYTVGSLEDVSEEINAKENLARAKERFRNLWDNSNDLLYSHDMEGILLAVNPAAERFLGYGADELIGRPFQEFVVSDTLAKAEKELTAKRLGEKTHSGPYEVQVQHRDGHTFWLEISATVRLEGGMPVCVDGQGRDISERRRRQKKIEESEASLRATYDRAPLGILTVGQDGKIQRANEMAETMFGVEPGKLVGLEISQFTHAEDLDESYRVFKALVAGALEQYDLEKRYVRPDGSYFWGRVRTNAIRDKDGNFVQTVSMLEDVSAERSAMQAKEIFADLAADMAASSTLDGALEIALAKMCKVTSWDYGEIWSVQGDELVLRPAWYASRGGLGKFRHLSEKMKFRMGEGIPGVAWQQGEAIWTEELAGHLQSVRAAAAAAAGMHSALAVPIVQSGETRAVVMFFMDERRGRDEDAVELAKSVCANLGMVMARREAETELAGQRVILEAQASIVPDGLLVISSAGEILSANPALLQICGFESDSLSASQALEIARNNPEFHEKIRTLYQAKTLESDNQVEFAGRLYERSSKPFQDPETGVRGRAWRFQDVGEAKRGNYSIV